MLKGYILITLNKSKLDDFKKYLNSRGIAFRSGKGETQVLQVMSVSDGWGCLYKRKDMPDHYRSDSKTESVIIGFFSEFNKNEELGFLECRYCDNTLDLRVNEPEKAGWKLIGLGVWYCPKCSIKHCSEINTNSEFFNSVTCLFAEGVKFMNKSELYDAIKGKWQKALEAKRIT
jgi:hypothetical protein